MQEAITDKCVLITGAGKRIGRALALDFAHNGWHVAVHYHTSRDAAESLATEIRALGRNAIAVPCDLGDSHAVRNLLPQCIAALGPVTCLINNASEFRFDSITDLSPESWDLHLNINLKAPVFLAKALADHLSALPNSAGQAPVRPLQGNIINIIDQRVWNLTPEFFSYTVSKAGLWSATRMLAQALAPRVRVNAIGPGPVLQSIHQTPEDFAREVSSTLLERGTTPDEIAQAIRFILGASAMTGQMVALDGGQHLAWSVDAPSASQTSAQTQPLNEQKSS